MTHKQYNIDTIKIQFYIIINNIWYQMKDSSVNHPLTYFRHS